MATDNPKGNAWLFASTANVHVANDLAWFTDYTPFDTVLSSGEPQHTSLPVVGIGSVNLPTVPLPDHDGGPPHILRLTTVLHAPAAPCNILGAPLMDSYNVQLEPHGGLIRDQSTHVLVGCFDPTRPLRQLKLRKLPGQAAPLAGLEADADVSVERMVGTCAWWTDEERQRWRLRQLPPALQQAQAQAQAQAKAKAQAQAQEQAGAQPSLRTQSQEQPQEQAQGHTENKTKEEEKAQNQEKEKESSQSKSSTSDPMVTAISFDRPSKSPLAQKPKSQVFSKPGPGRETTGPRQIPTSMPLADLRRKENLMPFKSLPEEDELLSFYDMKTMQPRRHWCLAAEIESNISITRTVLQARDRSGFSMRIAFYTPDAGRGIPVQLLKRGNTILIFYAEPYYFLDLSIGVRLEDPSLFKIIPATLNELLELNDRVRAFSPVIDGQRICHACGRQGQALRACSRCSFFWYCDKDCQRVGWEQKQHKKDCRLVRDRDVSGLFQLQWNKFSDWMSFPLEG